MHYINPFELLGLSAENLSDIDASALKKEKQKLLSEIELSDNGIIHFNKIDLSKSDCVAIIDELDNKTRKEFHFYIYGNKPLNNFLTSGDLTFFTEYKAESIFKETEFIDFISPYFSLQFNKALFVNFKNKKINNVKSLLSIKPLVDDFHLDKCYKKTYNLLSDLNIEIKEILKDIESEIGYYNKQNFEEIIGIVSRKINVKILNALPIYFQNIRNQIAQSIRNIEVTLYNDPFNDYKSAFQLIEFAKMIDSDGLALKTITKSYFIVKREFENTFLGRFNSSKHIPNYNDNDLDYEAGDDQALLNSDQIEEDDNDEIIDNKDDNKKNEKSEEEEIQEKIKEKRSTIIFSILTIMTLGFGFFYRFLQFFSLMAILIISVIMLLFSFEKGKKKFAPIIFIAFFVILIIGSILGFFYVNIGRVWMIFFFVNFIFDLVPVFRIRRLKNLFYFLILVFSIALTYFYNQYILNNYF